MCDKPIAGQPLPSPPPQGEGAVVYGLADCEFSCDVFFLFFSKLVKLCNCKKYKSQTVTIIFFLLELVIEISEKTKRKRPIFPLESQKGFQLLYNGEK